MLIVQNGIEKAREDVQRQIDEFLEANTKIEELNGEEEEESEDEADDETPD